MSTEQRAGTGKQERLHGMVMRLFAKKGGHMTANGEDFHPDD
jgi:hypothetical protein